MTKTKGKKGVRAKIKPTVHPSIAQQFLVYLSNQGVDVEKLYSRVLLDKINGTGIEGEILETTFCKMLAPAVEASGRPEIVFEGMMFAGERMFGELLSALTITVDVYEGMAHLIRYNHLTGCLGDFRASIEDDHRLHVEWSANDPTVHNRHLMEYRIAILALGIRRGCGNPKMPIDVKCCGVEPPYSASYSAALGGIMEYGSADCRVIAPSMQVSGELLRMAAAQATDPTQETASNPAELHALLTRFIGDYLPSGNIKLEHAATFLQVSGRTLQRWLDRTGIHYQELVDQVRLNQAKELLLDPNVSLSRIAFALGYTAQTNFQNAFRRWMGISPGEYRERQAGAVPRSHKSVPGDED